MKVEEKMSLTIGVLKERVEGETRVALTPEIAKKLVSLKAQILMEKDAGKLSNHLDSEYVDVQFLDEKEVLKKSDLLLSVQPISPEQSDNLKQNSYVIGMIFGHINKEVVQSFLDNKHTSFAMELMPLSLIHISEPTRPY